MNKKLSVIFIAISLAISAVMFIASDNIILTALTLVINLAVSFLLFIPKLFIFQKVTRRYHECFHFINNFIISLSIKKTVSSALENTSLSMDASFQDMYQGLENMGDNEKLNYLNGSYFPFHVYRLFLHVVSLFEEEGGDVLAMSKYLLDEARYGEEYVSNSIRLVRSKYIEVAILWTISLSILVLLRFALSDFFSLIKTQALYIISLFILSLFIIFTIFLLIKKATNLKLKGYDPHEKIV